MQEMMVGQISTEPSSVCHQPHACPHGLHAG